MIMTIEQIKADAKARYGQDITDEAAKTLLEKYPGGALTDGEQGDIAGGGFIPPKPGAKKTYPSKPL